MRRRYLIQVFIFLFIVQLGFSSSEEIFKLFERGKFDEAFAQGITFVKANKSSAQGYIIFRFLEKLLPYTGEYCQMLNLCQELSQEELFPELKLRLPWTWGKVLLKKGKIAQARQKFSQTNLITSWLLIGPFEIETHLEEEFFRDRAKEREYLGKREKVKWRKITHTPLNGYIPLEKYFYPNTKVKAYARVYFYLARHQTIQIRIGYANKLTLWLNGRQIFTPDEDYPTAVLAQKVILVELKKGWQELLLSISQKKGDWGFFLELLTLAHSFIPELKISLTCPEKVNSFVGKISSPQKFSQILKKEALHPFSYFLLLGYLHYLRYQYREALKYYREAEELKPEATLPIFFQGIIAEKQELIQDAITLYQEVVKKDPKAAASYWRLGLVFEKNQRQLEAIKSLQKALKSNPRFSQAILELSYQYYLKGWFKEAFDKIKEAIKLSPQNPLFYDYLGYYYQEEGKYRLAERAFKKALKLLPGDKLAREDLAKLYLTTGRYQKARQEYEKFLKYYPISPRVYLALGELFEKLNKPERALGYYQKGLSICPSDYYLWSKIGLLKHSQGEKKRAQAILSQSLKYKPDFNWLREYLSFLKEGSVVSLASQEMLQKFLESAPTAEEYPGCRAVILLDEVKCEVFPDGSSCHKIHQIIKIFTQEGVREYGEIFLPYNSSYDTVEVKKASTIKPDGSILEATSINHLAQIPQELGFYSDALLLSISMPGVSPDAIIEYEVEIKTRSQEILGQNFWDIFYFQSEDPIETARYTLTLPKGVKFNSFCHNLTLEPKISTTKNSLTYTWEKNEIEGILSEPLMPPFFEVVPKVLITTLTSWEEIGRWYNELCQEQFEETPEIQEKVAELVRGKHTLSEKIKALYEFVTQKTRYVAIELGESAYKPHQAHAVLKNGYGDCKDKSGLLFTMLKILGLNPRIALVRVSSQGKIIKEAPMLNQFNHVIVFLENKEIGEKLWLDPTAETWSYRSIPSELQGVDAFVIGPDGGEWHRIPFSSPKANSFREEIKIVLEEDGSAHGEVNAFALGLFSSIYRNTFKNKLREKEIVEALVNERVSGASVTKYSLTDVTSLTEPFEFSYGFEAKNFAQKINSELIVKPPWGELELTSLVSKSERRYPLRFKTYWYRETQGEIQLPPQYKVKTIPKETFLDTPYGIYQVKFQIKGNKIKFKHIFSHTTSRVPVHEYKAVQEFYQKVTTLEKQPIILSLRRY
jgi:tetratricopeptide (TPR) repeat protein